MQIGLISLLDGLVYGMLLFMLASGLTLILSMMGVLNFAHASIYMLGAYFAYELSRWIGFWPALIVAPLLCGAIGAAIEVWGLRRVHHNGHIAELLFTFGLVFIIGRACRWRGACCRCPIACRPRSIFRCSRCTATNFPAYRGFMLLVSAAMLVTIWLLLKKTRIGLIIQAALTHPSMVSALGHDVPRVFTIVFAGGSLLAGLAGVIAGNYLTTESGMADAMGPIVFVVVIFGGLGSLAGCFIASILMGMVQTFSVVMEWSFADMLKPLGIALAADDLLGEILNISVVTDRPAAAVCAADRDPAVPPAWTDGHARDMSDAALRALPSRRPHRTRRPARGRGSPRCWLRWCCPGCSTTFSAAVTPASCFRCSARSGMMVIFALSLQHADGAGGTAVVLPLGAVRPRRLFHRALPQRRRATARCRCRWN